MIDESRALSAYTDVLAVEHDEESGVVRIVTISDVYTAIPKEGLHICPDREYHGVDFCKHVVATEITRGNIDVPTGWLVVEDLDNRTEPEFELETSEPEPLTLDSFATDGGCTCHQMGELECFDCFNGAKA